MSKLALLALILPLAGAYAQASPTVVYASTISGVVLDANLSGASGQTCTDNSAALNAVLATATPTVPIDLIMDGASCLGSVATGVCLDLRGLSDVTVEGQGWTTGFFVKAGANCSAITNVYPHPGAGTTPSKGSNVTLKNFKLVGNAAGQSGASCPAGYCIGVELFNLSNVVLDGLYLTDIHKFATLLGNTAVQIGELTERLSAESVGR
jgi:hypothetical protein